MKAWPRRREIADIDGGLYLVRWQIVSLFGWSLMLHRFERSDWSRDLHDHPWSFITIPLVGGYWNETDRHVGMGGRQRKLVRWPWPRFRRAEHRHRVQLDPRWPHPWTLVLHFRRRRVWGFWNRMGSFTPWHIYCGVPAESES